MTAPWPTGPLDRPGPWSPHVAVADGDLAGEIDLDLEAWQDAHPEQTGTVVPTVICPDCGAEVIGTAESGLVEICCQDSWVPNTLAWSDPITWSRP